MFSMAIHILYFYFYSFDGWVAFELAVGRGRKVRRYGALPPIFHLDWNWNWGVSVCFLLLGGRIWKGHSSNKQSRGEGL
jgi:hypothetical protein